MDWLRKGESPKLEFWASQPVSGPQPRAGDHWDVHELSLGREEEGAPGAAFQRVADCILNYRIFPERLIRPVKAAGPLQAGALVGIHFIGFPIIDLFFACRVLRCFAEEERGRWCVGFVYQTLEGHPERGEERFAVEKDRETGELWGRLSSWSGPGLWLTWLGKPLVRRLQHYANQTALRELEQAAALRPAAPVLPPGTG